MRNQRVTMEWRQPVGVACVFECCNIGAQRLEANGCATFRLATCGQRQLKILVSWWARQQQLVERAKSSDVTPEVRLVPLL